MMLRQIWTPEKNFATMHTKQMPFRTYVIGGMISKGSLPPALWWDTGDQDSKWFTAPYHYVRTEFYNGQYDLLIAGGEDHKTGQSDEENVFEEQRYAALIQWTREHFPMMRDIVYKWSGQILEPLDYLAFIGRNPGNDNEYVITGDSGNGMTHGTLGGKRGGGNIDIWKLNLDGTGKDFVRLTHFNDYEGSKASNPVVSSDGKYMCFQFANTADPAGVGYGLLLYKFNKKDMVK